MSFAGGNTGKVCVILTQKVSLDYLNYFLVWHQSSIQTSCKARADLIFTAFFGCRFDCSQFLEELL